MNITHICERVTEMAKKIKNYSRGESPHGKNKKKIEIYDDLEFKMNGGIEK